MGAHYIFHRDEDIWPFALRFQGDRGTHQGHVVSPRHSMVAPPVGVSVAEGHVTIEAVGARVRHGGFSPLGHGLVLVVAARAKGDAAQVQDGLGLAWSGGHIDGARYSAIGQQVASQAVHSLRAARGAGQDAVADPCLEYTARSVAVDADLVAEVVALDDHILIDPGLCVPGIFPLGKYLLMALFALLGAGPLDWSGWSGVGLGGHQLGHEPDRESEHQQAEEFLHACLSPSLLG